MDRSRVSFLFSNGFFFNTVTRAFDTLRLSYTEQLLDVGCSIAALNLIGGHPLSRALFNIVIVYLLVELHSG